MKLDFPDIKKICLFSSFSCKVHTMQCDKKHNVAFLHSTLHPIRINTNSLQRCTHSENSLAAVTPDNCSLSDSLSEWPLNSEFHAYFAYRALQYPTLKFLHIYVNTYLYVFI